ncbi:Carbohydrate esterase, sialic acid-specific acetylesterase [uncultured archaeon]|nr:Carbohydrate esterase, sialic acid-specific acetylesterase [uncultured archaeon]
MTWSDSVDPAAALNFSISGLYPDTKYDIYDGTGIYNETLSDSNGNLLPIIINFTTSAKTIEVIQGGNIQITYPVQYFTKQRYNNTHGNITIHGAYEGNPASIEASFNGSSWKVINTTPSNGTFYGILTEQLVGQGNLEVRFSNDQVVTSSVPTIGIGDIFLVTGQSNSDCPPDINNSYLNQSNKYISTVYTHDDVWKKTEGSVCWANSSTSGWFPLLSDYIIQNTSIPVSWIVTGVGNTEIVNWQPGRIYFTSMQSQLNESTGNTGEIKAVLWYQGEKDAPQGNYTYYLENLTNYVNGVMAISTAKTVLVAQIGNVAMPPENRSNKDAVLRAQLTSWDTLTNVSPGVLTYDVLLTEPDYIHFKTDEQIRTLDTRWWRVINNSLYGGTIGRSPRLQNATFIGDSTILLTFDKNVYLSNNSNKAEGFYIQNNSLELYDANIKSSNINGKNITLYLNESISNANISLGSLNDGVGKNVPRDFDMYPAETFFYVEIEKDTTPPSSITGLGSTSTLNSVNWSWNNPDDVDFSHVMVYINDIFITNTSLPFYNLTGRNGSETWTISTHTVDSSGNINQTWNNHTAKTDALRDHTINGTVLGNGTGIAGATVSADIFKTKTNESGYYSILVPGGTFNLTVTSEPAFYPNSSVTVTFVNETTVLQDIELFLKPTGNISGSVTQV